MNIRKNLDFSSKKKFSNVVPIRPNEQYNETRIITKKILCIGNALKKDISKLMKLSSNDDQSPLLLAVIKKNKAKILHRLQGLSRIRDNTKIENEEHWREILHNALMHVYRHSNDNESYQNNIDLLTSISQSDIDHQNDIKTLTCIDQNDTSETGIHFLQEYMRIVARIPRDQIYSAFKP